MTQASSTVQFYVMDNSGNLVPAKVLTDDSGNPIRNPNFGVPFQGSKGPVVWGAGTLELYDANGSPASASVQNNLQYYIVPADFDLGSFLVDAITFSQDPVTEGQFWFGQGNLQIVHLMQNGIVSSGSSSFTLAFTDANSFLLGMTQASTNVDIISDAGLFNSYFGGRGVTASNGNPLRNVLSQDQGIDAFDNYSFFNTIEFLKANVDSRVLDFAHCFARGTEIACPRGVVPIEELKRGDLVFSYSHQLEANLGAEFLQHPGHWHGDRPSCHRAAQCRHAEFSLQCDRRHATGRTAGVGQH